MRPAFLTFSSLLLAASVFAQSYQPVSDAPPSPQREFRGAWVATVYNLDWPSKPGLPAETQKAQLVAILNKVASLNMNAVMFQVRPQCDALYASRIEPWAPYLTGSMGGDPGYDPLAFAVAEAHKRGIELHAWFNPFRALTNAGNQTSAGHVTRKHPGWIRKYARTLWIDPGDPKVREYSIGVIMDVVRRYNIDGVHLDDYFYPYKVAGAEFPDSTTYETYGGGKPRNEWRRQNINEFVRRLYTAVKSEKAGVKFGISPFGIWRPGVPAGIEAGVDSYDHLCSDSRKWLASSWLDYLSPQLYWSIEPAKQSFPALLSWWVGQSSGSPVWPGIATERIGKNRPASEIVRQIELTRAHGRSNGHIHWSMKSLMNNQGGISDLLKKTVYASRAAVPGGSVAMTPDVEFREGALHVKSAAPQKFLLLRKKIGTAWSEPEILDGATAMIPLPDLPDAVSIQTMDAANNLSLPATLQRFDTARN